MKYFIGLKPSPLFGKSSAVFAVRHRENIPSNAWSCEEIEGRNRKDALKKFGFRIIVWGCWEDHVANNLKPYIMTAERWRENEGWFRRHEPAFPD